VQDFGKTEVKRLEDLTRLYNLTKYILFYAEELKAESFIPPMNEFKDAFDHLMRVYTVKFELVRKDDDYVAANLDASFRHVYRATFELLDYIRIYQKEVIITKLENISREALSSVFPEYYKDIRPDIERIINDIPVYKCEKDIGDPTINCVEEYFNTAKKLDFYSHRIDEMLPGLIEYNKTKKREEREFEEKKTREKHNEYIIRFMIAVVCMAIGKIIL
jgi:hypothetical protein